MTFLHAQLRQKLFAGCSHASNKLKTEFFKVVFASLFTLQSNDLYHWFSNFLSLRSGVASPNFFGGKA